jgi:NADH dehydrogenase FAD-containing subunit
MGGFTVSNLISKQVGSSAIVTIVEPNARLAFAPAFQWLVFGWRQPEKIQRDHRNLSRKKNVHMVNDRVEKIDVRERTVKTHSETILYDKLVTPTQLREH